MSRTTDNCIGRITRCLITVLPHRLAIIQRTKRVPGAGEGLREKADAFFRRGLQTGHNESHGGNFKGIRACSGPARGGCRWSFGTRFSCHKDSCIIQGCRVAGTSRNRLLRFFNIFEFTLRNKIERACLRANGFAWF